MSVPITFKGADGRNFSRGRAGQRPGWIVCHRMVGFLNGTDRHFNRFDPKHPVSTHFGIGRRTPGGPVEISQYVALDDTAFGNGNGHRSSKWAARGFPATRINARTVSIEHEDGGKGHRGVVDPAVIEASIGLVSTLLSGDPVAVRNAGIRFRDPAVVTALGRIPVDANHIVDHHFISGKLKPFCWRKWLDDSGFPQARYLAELKGAGGAARPAAGTAPEAEPDESPILEGHPSGNKLGTAIVKAEGGNFIFADNSRRAVKGGIVRDVMAIIRLEEPIDAHPGDRQTLLLVESARSPFWGFFLAADTDWPAGRIGTT
jgi:hypothetical protein